MEDLKTNFDNIKKLNEQLDQHIKEIREKYARQTASMQSFDSKAFYQEIKDKKVMESVKQSVKPNVKVPNKRKKIKQEIKKYTYILTASAVLAVSIGGYGLWHHKDNEQLENQLREYKEQIYNPNMIYQGVMYNESLAANIPVHDHNWESMIEQIHSKYENPITAFYFYYFTLDEYCKNNYLPLVLNEINLYYGTNFKQIEDVLAQAGVKQISDLTTYVKNDLEGKRIDELGNRNIGR